MIDLRDPSAVCDALGLMPAEAWRQTWAQSARSFSPGKTPFLTAEYVRETCQTVRCSDGVTDALLESAEHVRASVAYERLAWHLHWLVDGSGYGPQPGQWPSLPVASHPAHAMFYGLIVLSAVPSALAINARRGIDPEITIETLSDLETWTMDHVNQRGTYRFDSINWMQHHLRGKLFKLGRLEYTPGTYGHPFRWYRHLGTGEVIALAEHERLFRPDGQFATADRGEVRDGLWQSRFEETLETITGSAVSPWGQVRREEVALDTTEWHEILRPRDPVMTVHIPSKDAMTPESCAASFELAVEFYRRHFPELDYRAFTCHSWLLDPQFEQLDPAPRNISAFLREWYLHPVEGADDSQHWQRTFDLFGDWQPKWDTAEAKTGLQRALVDFIKQGGHPRSGGSVLFAEDLNWGAAVYRASRKANLIP